MGIYGEATRVDRGIDEIAEQGKSDGTSNQPDRSGTCGIAKKECGECKEHNHTDCKSGSDECCHCNDACFAAQRGLDEYKPDDEPRTRGDDDAIDKHASWIATQATRDDEQESSCKNHLHQKEERLRQNLYCNGVGGPTIDELTSTRKNTDHDKTKPQTNWRTIEARRNHDGNGKLQSCSEIQRPNHVVRHDECADQGDPNSEAHEHPRRTGKHWSLHPQNRTRSPFQGCGWATFALGWSTAEAGPNADSCPSGNQRRFAGVHPCSSRGTHQ